MALLLALLGFLFVAVLVVALGTLLTHRRRVVRERLTDIRKMSLERDPEDMLRLPFMERVAVPFLSGLGGRLGNLAPKEIRSRMEKRILYAGKPGNITFAGLLALQVLLGAAFLVISLLLLRFMQVGGIRMVLIVLLLTFIGLFLPVGVINSRGEARQKTIRRALPDMLDLLLVSVEAGLGFDMALKKVTQQMPGPLSEEIRHALDEIRMGSTRESALRGIARRTGVPELSSFISAVIQSEQLGSNIAGTLRVQSDYM
ncbi:MAG TPA: type II secretion system F family protein, partial [Firmicutes bacterium]|nr:type II secretion system F family protein [Bacillota bacterium]